MGDYHTDPFHGFRAEHAVAIALVQGALHIPQDANWRIRFGTVLSRTAHALLCDSAKEPAAYSLSEAEAAGAQVEMILEGTDDES